MGKWTIFLPSSVIDGIDRQFLMDAYLHTPKKR